MMFKYVAIILSITIFFGCAGPIKQENLEPLDAVVETIVIEKNHKFRVKPKSQEYALLIAGEYKPVGKTKHGIFYAGPKKCLRLLNSCGKVDNCGILESSKDQSWKLFIFDDIAEARFNNPNVNMSAGTYGATGGAIAVGIDSLMQRKMRGTGHANNLQLEKSGIIYSRKKL